jgi:DNA-binding transcriptional ArsR family regulator
MAFNQDLIENASQTAAQLKLISNPNRLMIVCRLLHEEMSVGDIEEELQIRQPTLSRELGHLREAGVISPRRQSKVVFYSLTSAPMRNLIEAICETKTGSLRRHQTVGATPVVKSNSNAIAFNPRPKFTKARPPSPEDRGYSVFASTKKQGV